MSTNIEQCVRSGRTSDQAPLIRLSYQRQEFWICPQDLPVLIHKPQQIPQLAGSWTTRPPADAEND